MQITTSEPWLIADLGRMRRVLSFAPHRPGFRQARHILWRQVRDADLTPGLDGSRWLGQQMARLGYGDAVGMMTSRGLEHAVRCDAGPASCLATVGLGNAERVGHRRAFPGAGYGTINIALLLDAGLTGTAMIEALTIAAEARTAAVLAAEVVLPSGLATGTGTDCIALACDRGSGRFAGLHTELGAAIGHAVHDAVLRGTRAWVARHGQHPPAAPIP